MIIVNTYNWTACHLNKYVSRKFAICSLVQIARSDQMEESGTKETGEQTVKCITTSDLENGSTKGAFIVQKWLYSIVDHRFSLWPHMATRLKFYLHPQPQTLTCERLDKLSRSQTCAECVWYVKPNLSRLLANPIVLPLIYSHLNGQ